MELALCHKQSSLLIMSRTQSVITIAGQVQTFFNPFFEDYQKLLKRPIFRNPLFYSLFISV